MKTHQGETREDVKYFYAASVLVNCSFHLNMNEKIFYQEYETNIC